MSKVYTAAFSLVLPLPIYFLHGFKILLKVANRKAILIKAQESGKD